MIIKFEPHGFVVFFTLAMGMIYAIFNSRSGWGFWKLVLIGTTVVPFLYYGFVMGRVVEVVVGSLIGWLYARGGLSLPNLNPFAGIAEFLHDRKTKRAEKREFKKSKLEQARKERTKAKADKKANRKYSTSGKSSQGNNEEARRRQEKAKAKREQTKAQENANGSNSEHKYSDESHERRPPKESDKPVDKRTAHEILGVPINADQQQIKKAYASLRSRYHPDKYAHMSEAFRNEAEEELKKVNKAWKMLGKEQ